MRILVGYIVILPGRLLRAESSSHIVSAAEGPARLQHEGDQDFGHSIVWILPCVPWCCAVHTHSTYFQKEVEAREVNVGL